VIGEVRRLGFMRVVNFYLSLSACAQTSVTETFLIISRCVSAPIMSFDRSWILSTPRRFIYDVAHIYL